MASRPLGRIDQRPAVGDGQRRRHLDGHVLAPLHRVQCNGDVHLPVGTVIDQIDILQLADAAPVIHAGELLRRRQAVYRKPLLRPLDIGGNLVAEGDDLHAVELRETLDSSTSPHTQTDEGHAHDRNRVAAQLQHVLLPLGTLRFREDDHTVLDPIRRIGSRMRRAGSQQKSEYEEQRCTNDGFHGKAGFRDFTYKVRKNLYVVRSFITFILQNKNRERNPIPP